MGPLLNVNCRTKGTFPSPMALEFHMAPVLSIFEHSVPQMPYIWKVSCGITGFGYKKAREVRSEIKGMGKEIFLKRILFSSYVEPLSVGTGSK